MRRGAAGFVWVLFILFCGAAPSCAGESARTHEIIIAPRFDWAGPFSEGLAAVKWDGQTGYIDVAGRLVIEADEKTILQGAPFSSGRAPVLTEARTPEGGRFLGAYIDKSGALAIPPEFSHAGGFVNGTAVVKFRNNEYFSLIDPSGRELAALKPPQKMESGFRFDAPEPSFAQGPALFAVGQKKGYMAVDGTVAIRPIYDEAEPFSEGLAAVRINPRDPVGYINVRGETILAPRFRSAERFVGGFAVVQSRDEGHGWGVIDMRGEFVVPAEYYSLQYLGEGIYLGARQRGGQELVFPGGGRPVALDDEVHHVREFHEGLAAFVLPSSRPQRGPSGDAPGCGYIDTAGKSVFPERFRSCSDFKNGLAWVQDAPETERYFIDKAGRRVNPEIRDYGEEAEGLIPVMAYNGKWGYARRLP